MHAAGRWQYGHPRLYCVSEEHGALAVSVAFGVSAVSVSRGCGLKFEQNSKLVSLLFV